MAKAPSLWCLWRMSKVSLLTIALILSSCAPAPPAQAPPEPEPPPEDGIPWAAGERPENSESTTRDFQPLEEKEEPVDTGYPTDGITPARSTAICKGTEPAALLSAIEKRATRLSECRVEIPSGTSAQGDLIWAIRISETGKVVSLALVKDSLQIPSVKACGEKILSQSFTATPPNGGCVEYNIPLRVRTTTEPASEEQPAETESETQTE